MGAPNNRRQEYLRIKRELESQGVLDARNIEVNVGELYLEDILIPFYKWYMQGRIIGATNGLKVTLGTTKTFNIQQNKVLYDGVLAIDEIPNCDKFIIPPSIRKIGIDHSEIFKQGNKHTKIEFTNVQNYTHGAGFNSELIESIISILSQQIIINKTLCQILENHIIRTLYEAKYYIDTGEPSVTVRRILNNNKIYRAASIIEIHTDLLKITKGSKNTLSNIDNIVTDLMQSLLHDASRESIYNSGAHGTSFKLDNSKTVNLLLNLIEKYESIVTYLDSQSA